MRILDRYIIRHFVINFIVLSLVLLLLFVVIDLVVNLSEFTRAGESWAQLHLAEEYAPQFDVETDPLSDLILQRRSIEDNAALLNISRDEAASLNEKIQPGIVLSFVGTVWKVFDYYGPLSLVLYVFFSGLVAFGAMGFTLTNLLRTRELTAMVAGGISLYRVGVPILLMGIVVNAAAFPIQELLIPPLASKLARGAAEVRFETVDTFSIHLEADLQNNLLLSAGQFDAGENEMRDVVVLVRDDQGIARKRIAATRAVWEEETQSWELMDGGGYATVLTDDVDHTQIGSSLTRLDPVHVSAVQTNLSPTVILARQAAIYSRLVSLDELQTMESNQAISPDRRDRITQVVWSRFSFFVLNLLVLAMGLPFFLLKVPTDMLPKVVMACGICLGALFGGILMLQVTTLGMNPIANAWFPVVIYLPITAWLLQQIDT